MKKIKKILLSIFLPVVMILTAGILSFASITEIAHALSGNGGGLFVGSNTTLNFNATISGSSATNGGGVYVSNGGTFNMNGGSISGNTATDGGGVYVANDGTFNMNGGSISGNKATNNGDSIYNNGTFIMTGGTLGETNGVAWVYCDRNAVTQIYGGTVHDNFYMYSNLQTKMGTTINGKIFLAETSTITVQDYAGTTPEYNIEVSSSRQSGTIVTFKGSTVEPILSKINVTGYDSESYAVKTKKDSSGNWTISLVENSYDFPTTWKTEVASSTHMTTTVTPANLTSIKFAPTVPSGYSQIGTLSTGLPVYQGTTATEIAFVSGKIMAPKSCYCLFSELSNLYTIDFDNFDTSKVIDISMFLFNCASLVSIDLSGFNTANVTVMAGLFTSCEALTNVNLSGFNSSKVTNMNSMFSSCRSLIKLDLSMFDTSNVTGMISMFYNCSSLTSLDLSNFNTSKVEGMGNMFQGCSGLKNLDLSNFDTSNTTGMGAMFSGCSSLETLDVSSFNMSKCEIAPQDAMFNFGSSNRIKILKTPYNNAITIGITTANTLYDISTGAAISSIPANTTASKTYATKFTLNFDANGGTCGTSNMTGYYGCSLSETGASLPSASQSGYNFAGWYTAASGGKRVYSSDKLTFTESTTLYAHWTESGGGGGGTDPTPTEADYTFNSTWKEVLDGLEVDAARQIEHIMFTASYQWYNEKSGDYSLIGTYNCIDIYADENRSQIVYYAGNQIVANEDCVGMFSGLYALQTIIFHNFDTFYTTDFGGMFRDCPNLKFIDFKSFQTPRVQSMTYMFSDDTSLLGFANAVFDCISLEDASYMFNNCSAYGSTSLQYNGEYVGGMNMKYTYNLATTAYMFYGCLGMGYFSAGSLFFTDSLQNIDYMFGGCTSLTHLNLSVCNFKNVTSNTGFIDECSNLALVYTPRFYDFRGFPENLVNAYERNPQYIEMFGLDDYRLSVSICFINPDNTSISSVITCNFGLGIGEPESGSFYGSNDSFRAINDNSASTNFCVDAMNDVSVSMKTFVYSYWSAYYLLPNPFDDGLSDTILVGWSYYSQKEQITSASNFVGYDDLYISQNYDYGLYAYTWDDSVPVTARYDYSGGEVFTEFSTPYEEWEDTGSALIRKTYQMSFVRYIPTFHKSGEFSNGWNTSFNYYTNMFLDSIGDGALPKSTSNINDFNPASFPPNLTIGTSTFVSNQKKEKELQKLISFYNSNKQTILIPEDKKVTITELKLKKVS